MQFQRVSLRSFRLYALAFIFTIAAVGSLSAQDAPPPGTTGAAAQSSSSDTQQAQIVQKPKDVDKRDIAILGFGQDTNRTNGNSLRNGTTSSGGGMVSFRQSPRWWAGYEASYGYTKYTDTYYFNIYRVEHTSNEGTLAYLVKSPAYDGFHFFGTLGAGILSLSPTQSGGSVAVILGTPATQTVPTFVYTLGVERRFTDRFGFRVQYRSDEYKDPDFKQSVLDTHQLRKTAEPGIGVYYHF